MANVLKYILQYYALGTSASPYYQYKIFQDSANWNVLDGPLFLQADGDEPTTHELFESQGPIKPSSIVLNLINKRYSPEESREIDDVATVWNGITGEGSGDLWLSGDGGAIYTYAEGSGTPTIQTSGTSEDLHAIAAGPTDILVSVGNDVILFTSIRFYI